MELKATLKKPFNEQERLDFIVLNNHQQGNEIKETETALEAWGLPEEEQAEKSKQDQIAQLSERLAEIDAKTIRPLRAIQSGQGIQADTDKLAELETQAEAIRAQIRYLGGGL
jgi:hypothetical protein